MRPADLALHGVSLACCLALGAGLVSVSRREPRPAASAVPVPSKEVGHLEDRVRALSAELGALRESLVQAQADREALRGEVADLRAAPAPAPAPAPGTLSAPSLAIALEDPGVEEKLSAAVDRALGRREEARQARAQEAGRKREEARFDRLGQELGLNEAQKVELRRILDEARTRRDSLRQAARTGKLPRKEARGQMERDFAETDARAQAVLTMEQFQRLQEISAPSRKRALRGLPGADRP